MEHVTCSKRHLARNGIAGLVAGIGVGLVDILILMGIDLVIGLSLGELLGIVLAWGMAGLALGLLWGLLRPAQPAHEALAPRGKRVSYLARSLAPGLGAGLVAGILVSLVEIAGLVIVDGSWWALSALFYAAVAYGLLGLLGGLVVGLLWGAWAVWRRSDALVGHPAWPAFVALVALVGLFLVIHNRVRRSVLGIPPNYLDLVQSLLVDNALLLLTMALGVGLWLLLRRFARHRRLVQLRWNAGIYLAFLLVAALVSQVPGLIAAPAAIDSSIPAHLRDRPNVILIVAETLRADCLGCYQRLMDDRGGSLTPNLDALAQDGVLYCQMSAQAPWTRPSVATILTSLYPTSHGAITMDRSLSDAVTTLPECLSTVGYRTGGLVTIGNIAPSLNFDQGFDRYVFLAGDRPYTFDNPVASRFAVSAFLRRLYNIVRPFGVRPQNEIYPDAFALNQQALAWLEANEESRFFLYLHYFDPHAPYFAHPYDGTRVSKQVLPDPAPSQASYLQQLYDGEVTYLDRYLGEFFDELKAQGLYDDALIIFTADHGEEFYEHQGWWHGGTLYAEQLAVPLIVKYLGNVHAGTVDHEIARSLDIAPTVLDVALFDLQVDPWEQRNLVAKDPDTARRLRAILDQVVAYAQANAVASQAGELDADTRERLQQLGY